MPLLASLLLLLLFFFFFFCSFVLKTFIIIIQDTSEYTNGINTCTILLLLLIHTHDIIAHQNTTN